MCNAVFSHRSLFFFLNEYEVGYSINEDSYFKIGLMYYSKNTKTSVATVSSLTSSQMKLFTGTARRTGSSTEKSEKSLCSKNNVTHTTYRMVLDDSLE